MNHPLRTINVLTFSLLLILTGCMGAIPEETDPIGDADAQDSGTPSTGSVTHANAPVVSLNWNSAGSVNYNATGVMESVTMSVYHAAVDADGDIVEMGYDLDLDGTIDVNVTAMHGWTTFNQSSQNFVMFPSNPDYEVTTYSFIARDATGMAAVEMVTEVVEVNTYVPPSGNPNGGLLFFVFDAEDAGGDLTDGTDDNLIRVTMTQGSAVNWSSVNVKIGVNNGAPIDCDRQVPGETVDTSCALIEFGDDSDADWSVSDGVTIVENGQAICSAGETCSVKVTITNTHLGVTMDEVTTVAQ